MPDELSGERNVLPGDLPDTPRCPFCEGVETELLSLFGSHASVTSYWCRKCRSPFEFMKWGERRSGAPENPGADL